jgi:hypothetical protein
MVQKKYGPRFRKPILRRTAKRPVYQINLQSVKREADFLNLIKSAYDIEVKFAIWNKNFLTKTFFFSDI